MDKFKIGDIITAERFLDLEIVGIEDFNYLVIPIKFKTDDPSKLSKDKVHFRFHLTVSCLLKNL